MNVTIIVAPSSTKNHAKVRDSEVNSNQKTINIILA